MDEGKVHDKLGREGDFSNAIIIFTSNIGSQWIAEQIQKGHQPTSNELIEVMSKYFRPEFLGRLTEVVPFLTYYRTGCTTDIPSTVLTPTETAVRAEGNTVRLGPRDHCIPHFKGLLTTVWSTPYRWCGKNLPKEDYLKADSIRNDQARWPYYRNL